LGVSILQSAEKCRYFVALEFGTRVAMG